MQPTHTDSPGVSRAQAHETGTFSGKLKQTVQPRLIESDECSRGVGGGGGGGGSAGRDANAAFT